MITYATVSGNTVYSRTIDMLDLDPDDTSSFHEDMIRIIDRLPTAEEYRRVQHLILLHPSEPAITDNQLAEVLDACPHLESVVLSGVPDTTDRTIVLLAENALNLQGIDLTGCVQVTDVGVLELATQSPPLRWIRLNGVTGTTDPSVSAIAKSCSRLMELELCDLPLLTPLSVRDVWSFSRSVFARISRMLIRPHCS
jgi:F-box and leucine-rich repeat protein GRR1